MAEPSNAKNKGKRNGNSEETEYAILTSVIASVLVFTAALASFPLIWIVP